jgi:Uma2 family endonuclease
MATSLALKYGSPVIPPLEQGDRLSRAEFERRYEAMPHVKKAELIEGVVHMPSPVRANRHSDPHADLMWWLGTYRVSTPGVRVSDNGTVRLDEENEPQPDASMRIEWAYGGQARVDEDDYVEGGPELAAEVASSSASIDLHDKLRAYQRNNVREYIVWRILDGVLDWFVLRRGRYAPLKPTKEGIYQSKVFPGLWLDAAALTRFDLTRVLEVAQQGVASPEHARFVAKLQRAGRRGRR